MHANRLMLLQTDVQCKMPTYLCQKYMEKWMSVMLAVTSSEIVIESIFDHHA